LFGMPDMEEERTNYAIEIPKLGSFILTHEWDGEVKGLKAWPKEDRPYAPVVFWTFRIMVGLGMAMMALGFWSLWLRYRNRLFEPGLIHRAAILMGPSGFVAVIAGWVTTEMGRQPYTVYGLLRTAESASPIDAPAVAVSLIAFIVVYFILFGAGTVYLLRLMAKPPSPDESGPAAEAPIRSSGLGTPPGLTTESFIDGLKKGAN
jgi:cytochrome d ubiquinol oxidase subunit I